MIRRIGRGIASPVRRFFNPRFESLDGRVQQAIEQIMIARQEIVRAEHGAISASHQVKDLLTTDMASSTEATKVLASYLSDLLAVAEEIRDNRPSRPYFDRLVGGKVEDVDEALAAVLNYAISPFGFAAQRGLWLNPPVWPVFERGDVRWGGANERIAEVPYVFRALGRVAPGARLLDVGSAESTVAISLASLGYRVTALDPRPQVFSHPNLVTVTAAVEDWHTDVQFDAVVCLSTIEHLGLGAYDLPAQDDADRRAMRHIHGLAAPGALLVLTVPFGRANVDWLQRTYDRPGLDELLEGWRVEDLTVVRRRDDWTWEVSDAEATDADPPGAALITAHRQG